MRSIQITVKKEENVGVRRSRVACYMIELIWSEWKIFPSRTSYGSRQICDETDETEGASHLRERGLSFEVCIFSLGELILPDSVSDYERFFRRIWYDEAQ